MRNFLYIVFFLIASFVLNIFVYYFSSDYRDFLKNIKGIENELNTGDLVVNTDLKVDIKSIGTKKNDENLEKENKKLEREEEYIMDSSSIYATGTINKDDNSSKVEYISVIEELKMTKVEEDLLTKFREYSLKEVELHPRLFDLTSEYPDNYFEYYSDYLTLYFFGNKPYINIKDIFDVLTYELPFTVNEVNNFGDKSFYINLKEDFQDDMIRIVFLYKNRTIGVKVKKDFYSHIKEKLESLQ
ncbi:MAG: hypothetical protein PHH06_05095 [Candidatus Gracilibacteria bacterium]|nr:hypothetical protein [Candidatus Gracilibacteria bacterium]